jgi:hypothetical protein
METVFYNETNSRLLHPLEIYHAFVLSIFADSVHLHCHNSTLYNLHLGDHHWSDQKLRELYDMFEKHSKGELEIERSQLELILTNMSKLNRIKHKNKTEIGLLHQGSGFKKNLIELLDMLLEEMLAENRVFGLQSVINKKAVIMSNKLSVCPDKHENIYIRELGNVFVKTKIYQVVGESVYKVFRMLDFKAAQSKLLPRWIKNTFDTFAIDILNFPLVCDLAPDQLLYLREQLHPEFGEFRNRLDQFRESISGMQYSPENLKKITDLFNQGIGSLRMDLQQKVDQQLYIQFMRNNYKDYGLKLILVVAPVSKMIDYYYKTGIVPVEVTEALKRNLSKETDLNRCDLFLHVTLTENLKKRKKRKPSDKKVH